MIRTVFSVSGKRALVCDHQQTTSQELHCCCSAGLAVLRQQTTTESISVWN